MKLARIYDILLNSVMLCAMLCSLIACAADDEEMQPGRLIDAFGFDQGTFKRSWLPLHGSGVIKTSTIIELVFDKPVLAVNINHSAKAQPNEKPPATVWKLDSNRLEDVWNLQIEGSPDREVVLMVIYEDETGIHKDMLRVTLDLQSNSPRVIAVDPKPSAQRSEPVKLDALTQEFRITFNEPIIPNSGRILFGNSRIQLQDTEPTDVITWNQCWRQFRFLEPDDTGELIITGSLVISDFVNVNYDVQPLSFVGWYWMPHCDITGPAVIEHYPIGQDVDPETTRIIHVVFDRPMEEAFCEIAPAITLSPAHIENETIKGCSGIANWKFVGIEQLDYSTQYDVKIKSTGFLGNQAIENFSFTTRAAPF